jgi:hypothetical protein
MMRRQCELQKWRASVRETDTFKDHIELRHALPVLISRPSSDTGLVVDRAGLCSAPGAFMFRAMVPWESTLETIDHMVIVPGIYHEDNQDTDRKKSPSCQRRSHQV